jgi:HK97 family phage major capsid protein
MSILEQVKARRDQVHAARGLLLDGATAEKRGLHDHEEAKYLELGATHAELVARVNQLERQEKAEAAQAGVRKLVGMAGTTETGLYGGFSAESRGGQSYHPQGEHSFFKDLISARSGDFDAINRLNVNNQETRTSAGLGSYTSSHGADFSPPGYLDVVAQARAGSVFANLVHQVDLPSGVSSVNLPRVLSTGGTTVATQAVQNTAVSNVDVNTDLLTSGVTTVAGAQVVSQQLLDQTPSYGGATIDQILMADLAADFARNLDVQALTGSGANGQLKGYVTAAVADNVQNTPWTLASPTGPKFFAKVGSVISAISTGRFKAPDAVVVHPRRFAWLASLVDTAGRPYVNATGGSGGFSNLANASAPAAEGQVGTILGVPVYADANVPVNLGTGADQDVVLVLVKDDPWLWTSPIQADVFNQPMANSLGVYLRLYAYSAFIPNRYPLANGLIYGTVGTGSTGLVNPVFATT